MVVDGISELSAEPDPAEMLEPAAVGIAAGDVERDRVRDGAQTFFATMFLYLARSADEALAEIGRPSAAA